MTRVKPDEVTPGLAPSRATDSELTVIINPVSGNGRAGRRWPEIARRMRARGISLVEHRTTGPGDAERLARTALIGGAREIVVVGGDGTANEVVNGFFDDGQPVAPDAVLSVVPCGTGRDFARSLGIRSIEEAVDLIGTGPVAAIDVGHVTYHNDGKPTSRYFVNCADVGLGAETAALINRSSKALGGLLAYLLGAVRTIVTFRGQVARVRVDGQDIHHDRMGMVVLANGRYHAGGMFMAPDASMTDGEFDILVLRDVPKPVLLGSLLPRVYRGKHIGHPAVFHCRGRQVDVIADGVLPFEADGEQPGTTDLRAVVLPAALSVRIPPAARVGASRH